MATGWLWEERYAWFDAMTWNDFDSTPAKSYVQPQEAFENPETKRRFRNLLDVSATVEIEEEGVVVTLDKRAHTPYLVASGLADEPTPMPWFGNRHLFIRFA